MACFYTSSLSYFCSISKISMINNELAILPHDYSIISTYHVIYGIHVLLLHICLINRFLLNMCRTANWAISLRFHASVEEIHVGELLLLISIQCWEVFINLRFLLLEPIAQICYALVENVIDFESSAV